MSLRGLTNVHFQNPKASTYTPKAPSSALVLVSALGEQMHLPKPLDRHLSAFSFVWVLIRSPNCAVAVAETLVSSLHLQEGLWRTNPALPWIHVAMYLVVDIPSNPQSVQSCVFCPAF